MIAIAPIQGMLLGIEWDWDNEWFALNLLIVKLIFNYGKGVNEPTF